MAVLALGLWILYGALALALRVWLLRRRTGRTGLVSGRTRPWSAVWVGETGQGLAHALGVAAPILALTGALDPIGALDVTGLHAAGIAIYAAGLALIVVAQEAMGASWRIGIDPEERSELVTAGPFARVRNPIFTGVIATQAGLALLVPSVVALAGLGLLVAAVHLQVRRGEEPHLLSLHGDAYAGYASRTGRFLPGLGRLGAAD